jgi:hypothetical protein
MPPGLIIDVHKCRAKHPLFGEFDWDEGNGLGIVVRDGWQANNIIDVSIPQAKGIPMPVKGGATPNKGTIKFHKDAAQQLQELWKAWDQCGFLPKVNSLSGYEARYQHNHGPTEKNPAISNHAFGSAFDINISENPRTKEPARLGERGCVREMVEVAQNFGFYWGGHFKPPNTDGMHFEVAKIM